MVLWVFHRTPAQEKRLLQIQGNGRRLTISFSRQHTLTIACHERKLTLLRYHNRQPWPRHISAAAFAPSPTYKVHTPQLTNPYVWYLIPHHTWTTQTRSNSFNPPYSSIPDARSETSTEQCLHRLHRDTLCHRDISLIVRHWLLAQRAVRMLVVHSSHKYLC